MVKRKIVEIDEDKCNGCGQCIPNCKEGALKIIDGKVRLISDLFCDGLGACLGHCPTGAITIIEREAEPYNETKVMEKIVKQGKNTIKAHLEHMYEHNETKYLKEAITFLKKKKIEIPEYKSAKKEISKKAEKVAKIQTPLTPVKMNIQMPKLACGCPGSAMREVKSTKNDSCCSNDTKQNSELKQWPIQLNLLPPFAPFFKNDKLLISADCVGFANPNFHQELLKGKAIAIGCPKLDNLEAYEEKITEILKQNPIKEITVAIMEVPCCYGLKVAVENAITKSKKKINLTSHIINVDGTTQ